MSRAAVPLEQVRVASPCHAAWDDMSGDDRVRHCGRCEKNVYNLSGMTRAEAEALVRRTEGELCIRFYRRADGTVLTRDCPVGLAALRRPAYLIAALAAAFLLAALGLVTGAGFTVARLEAGGPWWPAPIQWVLDFISPPPTVIMGGR